MGWQLIDWRSAFIGEMPVSIILVRSSFHKWDTHTIALGVSSYNGDPVKRILVSSNYARHIFAMDVFDDRLYWSDWHTGKVYSANKLNGKDIITIITDSSQQQPLSLKVRDFIRQISLYLLGCKSNAIGAS
jgi:hypothetical protein